VAERACKRPPSVWGSFEAAEDQALKLLKSHPAHALDPSAKKLTIIWTERLAFFRSPRFTLPLYTKGFMPL
jgi:hypothetical protein